MYIKMTEQVFNVKFVQVVEKYPCLYNYNLADYSRKDITEAAWSEVGNEMNISVADCKKKWKNLRAVFVRQIKFDPSGSNARKKKYYLTDVMQFILPYLKFTAQSGNLPDSNNSLQESEDETEYIKTEISDNDTVNSSYSTSNLPDSNNLQESEGEYKVDISDMVIDNDAENPHSVEWDSQPSTSSSLQVSDPLVGRGSNNKRKKSLNEVERFANFFKDRQMRVKEEDNLRKMFLLSLLEEVNKMSDVQMRLFKRKVLTLIDEIMSSTVAK